MLHFGLDKNNDIILIKDANSVLVFLNTKLSEIFKVNEVFKKLYFSIK